MARSGPAAQRILVLLPRELLPSPRSSRWTFDAVLNTFVEAVRAPRRRPATIVGRHVMLIPHAEVLAAGTWPSYIVIDGDLSFSGRRAVTWRTGRSLEPSAAYLAVAWWMGIFPGWR